MRVWDSALELVPKAHVIGDTRGVVSSWPITRRNRFSVLHIVASHAARPHTRAVLAVKNGLTIDDIIDTVHVFPTLSESIKLAAHHSTWMLGR